VSRHLSTRAIACGSPIGIGADGGRVTISRRTLLHGLPALALGCGARIGRGPGRRREDGVLRVLTLNLAHGRARAWTQSRARKAGWYRNNLDVVARVLEREAPDVVALQEAELGSRWAGMFDHVAYLAERAKLRVIAATPHVVARGRFRYGTALLGIGDALETGGDDFRTQGRWDKGYTWARLRIGTVELTVVSLHLDFMSAAVRDAQAQELAARLADAQRPFVVLGDFNATWHSPDSPVQTVARHLGLAAFEPDRRRPHTFSFGRRRLDWILASPDLELVEYRVLVDDRLSDHRAVIADLRPA